MEATKNPSRRELAYRSSAGIDVTLLWDERSGELIVTAFDSSTGELLEVRAEHQRALDVFYHPYAYAACGAVSQVSRCSSRDRSTNELFGLLAA